MLDMSVTPVREAFVGLASDGWIELESHRGAYVRPITRESVDEFFQLSSFLMEFIVKRAIERWNPGHVSRLLAIAEEVGGLTMPDEIWAKQREFNICLCEMGHSTRARILLRSVGIFVLDSVFELVPESVANSKNSISGMAAAVHDGDAARAMAVFRTYLGIHLGALLDWLIERGIITDDVSVNGPSESRVRDRLPVGQVLKAASAGHSETVGITRRLTD
jgi:DNA-binding GntR family transcriptional regulator